MRTPEVLAVPAFRTYFVAQSVSALGSAMSALAVTFAIIGLGGSATDLGVVLAAGTVPALLLMLVGGVAGDRWDRRLILLVTDAALGLTMGTLGVLVLTGQARIWHFVVGELVAGAALAFTGPTTVALLPALVQSELLQSANTLRTTSRNIAKIIGPPLAGILVAAGSPGWALLADAASYLFSGALMLVLPASRGLVRAGATVWDDVRHGWQAFSSRRWVWLMVLSFAVYQATTLPAIFVLGPILSTEQHDGASTWAVVLSARAVGAVLAGFVLLRWRPRRPLVTSAGIILLDVPFLVALAAGLPVPALIATSVVSSMGMMASDTLWESTLQARVPGDVLSRVSSYDWFGSILINPLGFAFIGAVASGWGAAPVLAVVAGIEVLVHGSLMASRSIRAEPAEA